VAANLFAGETLRLKLEPDRDIILKGSPQEVVVKIDLSALDGKTKRKRTPLNLAVVLDRSGSMSGAKIERARQAAMGIVDQLGAGDFFSFVTYSDRANVLVPAQQIEDKEMVKRKIAGVQPGGSTALYDGVDTGAAQVQRNLSSKCINRIILLSDGLANVGPSSTHDLQQLGRKLSERGIAVTTIGVGDDYNEDLMAGLAEASDANYYYVKDTEKLPEIFARELGELRTVAARGVRIEIICPEGIKPMGLIGRPEKFEGQKASVQLSQFTTAQNRYLLLRCQVQETQSEVARVKVVYTDELNGGIEDSAVATAKITFTDDAAVSLRSQRAEVVTQRDLLLAAIAKDNALADADAGRYKQAAQTLQQQADVLDKQYADAPPEMQSQVRAEALNLRSRAVELNSNQYSSGSRKALQSESWNLRNSKSYQSSQ
jgi:Ca-activated chloride channel family protein